MCLGGCRIRGVMREVGDIRSYRVLGKGKENLYIHDDRLACSTHTEASYMQSYALQAPKSCMKIFTRTLEIALRITLPSSRVLTLDLAARSCL